MIRKVVNVEEFEWVVDQAFATHSYLESAGQGHKLVEHDIESIKNNYANASMLNFKMHVWADIENNKLKSVIIFTGGYNPKFNAYFLNEFFWASNSPRSSFSVLRAAEKWAKENNYEYMTMGIVESMPKKKSLRKAYERMGFEMDCETYIKSLT